MKEQYTSYRFSEDFHIVSYDKTVLFEMVETILSFLCFYTLYSLSVYVGTLQENAIYRGLPLFLSIAAINYLRKRIKNLYIFILSVICTVIISSIVFYSKLLIIYNSIFLITYAFYYIRKRVKNKNAFLTIANLVQMNFFIAFVYGFSLLYKADNLKSLIFIFNLAHIIISIVYFYLSNSEKMFYWEKLSNTKYRNNLIRINFGFSLVITLIVVLIIFVSYKLEVFKILDYAYLYLLKSLLTMPLPNTNAKDIQMDKRILDDSQLVNMARDSFNVNSDSLFWTIFSTIAFIGIALLLIIAAIGVIMSLAVLIQLAYKRLLIKEDYGTSREFILTKDDLIEVTKSTMKNSMKYIRKIVYKSNREKVRNIYFNTVENFRSKGVNIRNEETPKEIEDNIARFQNVKLAKATAVYEKARYGFEEVTDGEVREMHNYFKKHK